MSEQRFEIPDTSPPVELIDQLVMLQGNNEALVSDNEKLRKIAATDDLTSLNNRLGLRNWGSENYDPYRSYAILAIDVADFGSYNDKYGQAVGDEALQIFGEVLPNLLRIDNKPHPERRTQTTKDAAATGARIGGDEFICVIDLDHVDLAKFEEIMMLITARISASYASATREVLPETPRIRMGSVFNKPGETFEDFFLRGNNHITQLKKAQKLAEVRHHLENMERLNVSFS